MADDKSKRTEDTPAEAEQPSNPVGRPLKFKTVGELDMAIQAYFDEQDPHIVKHMEATGFNERGQTTWAQRDILTEQRPYTMSGLARALGMSRQGLLDYSNRDEFVDSIADAKQRCEEYWEGLLASPYSNGAKFNLNNNYQGKYQPWSDKQEVDHTSKGKRLEQVPVVISQIAPRSGTGAETTESDITPAS